MTNTINTSYYLPETKTPASGTNNKLGKDTFLKLLITQLQNQDPLNPMEDREFISQMAVFSQLEQTIQIHETMKELADLQKTEQLLSLQTMIGKRVDWLKSAGREENSSSQKGSGIVNSIKLTGEGVKIYLNDGTELLPEDITGFHSLFKANSLIDASHLIGKQVGWQDNGGMKYAIVKSVLYKKGQIVLQLEDGNTEILPEQILSIGVKN